MRPVNRSSSATAGLTDQAAAEIRRAIADGEAAPGERLPPAKDIAAVLGVNRNTVLTACGCCATRASSTSAADAASSSPGPPRAARSSSTRRALVRFARSRGYERDELVQIIRSVS